MQCQINQADLIQIFSLFLFSFFNPLVQPSTWKKVKGGKKKGLKNLVYGRNTAVNTGNPKAARKSGCDPFLEINTRFHSYSRQWPGNISSRRIKAQISWDHFRGAQLRFKSHTVENTKKIIALAEGASLEQFCYFISHPISFILDSGKPQRKWLVACLPCP